MQMKTGNEQKYDVSVLKLVRNNNIAAGMENAREYDTYFMLDYFDLLYHSNLTSGDKVYKKYLNINDGRDVTKLNYKTAYKILSLYAKRDNGADNIFQIDKEDHLSDTPFLGIIQINFVHYIYSKKYDEEKVIEECEKKIREHVDQVISLCKEKCKYHLYRSSTSGDFCLVVKSAAINVIFKLASSINNWAVSYEEQYLIFNTYTNLGIECLMGDNSDFCNFMPETLDKNKDYIFALRFTVSKDFAKKLYDKVKAIESEREIIIETMEGLFGRYDFLLYLSMSEFSDLYPILCKSKIIGWNPEDQQDIKNDSELITLLQEGIIKGEIRVINERVLVPLAETSFEMPKRQDMAANDGYIRAKEQEIESLVCHINQKFEVAMQDFNNLEQLFIEKRREYIDVSRELWEIISTYVPQGRERDAYVNWQILVSDLTVTFESIRSWHSYYNELKSDAERRQETEYFLDDLRLNVDAINRFYTFLQNVNAQTWQAPLYEIQTQLDAEKLMIAYREFLHEYYEIYNSQEDGLHHKCMFNPIVYPDMMIDKACAMETFKRYNTEEKLLICKVPSFEYYGRMFDMIPWILHEASHSLRTMDRETRNEHLTGIVIKSVISQMMYELLNRYSNDYGYYRLGMLENEIVKIIVSKVNEEFISYLKEDKNTSLSKLPLNFLETELLIFLKMMFPKDIDYLENNSYDVNMKEIKKVLLNFFFRLGILSSEKTDNSYQNDILEQIENLERGTDYLLSLLRIIYNEYYNQLTDHNPENEEAWKILIHSADVFEDELKEIGKLEKDDNKEEIRDFCFSMRELNRLYDAYVKGSVDNKKGDKIRYNVWKKSIPDIKEKIEWGFQEKKGFTELYRILNMVFGGVDEPDDNKIKQIGEKFDILFWQNVYGLVDREIKIYREVCADLYVAAALGLDAFGYCRQMFQTVSDAGMKDDVQWIEAINIHRFRTVAAVLLGEDNEQNEEIRKVSIEKILAKGEEYCCESIECIKNTEIFKTMNGSEIDLAEQFLKDVENNIRILFAQFKAGVSIQTIVKNSIISLYLDQDKDERKPDSDVQKLRDELVKKYSGTWNKLKVFQHVIYRIKCFILLLDMIGHNGYIKINEQDYRHLKGLYSSHKSNFKAFAQNQCCRTVAEYYNNPSSAKEKTHEIMLEDTLDFIQTYYYKNRFKIMASDKIKRQE